MNILKESSRGGGTLDELEMQRVGYDGKIYNKLTAPTDLFLWRIKFPEDTPLALIPEDNFYVTDRENNLLAFELQLDRRTNSVMVSPMEAYDRNKFYFLHIKRYEQVNTIEPKKMPAIHVGFRLDREERLELIWMKGRFDPETVMQKAIAAKEKRSTSFKQEFLGKARFIVKPSLIKIAIVLGIIKNIGGMVLDEVPIFNTVQWGIALLIFGLVMIQYIIYFIGDQGKKKQSVENYNRAIANYSVGYYQNAENYLNKALVLDPKNQLVETALDINRKYLTKDLAILDMKSMRLERKVFRYNDFLIWAAGFIVGIEALFSDVIPTTSSTIEYLYIFLYTMIVMHFIFLYVQKKGYDKLSADEYNTGADAFEAQDYEQAMRHFRAALKLDIRNLHASHAKDLINIIVVADERKKRMEEEEEIRRQRIEAATAKMKADD